MLRIALIVFLSLAATPTLAQPGAAPSTPALKRDVTVTGDLVRIGDLIENAGILVGIAIFRAPDLGQTGSVPAAQVIAAARTHGLAIVEAQGISEVTVTRAAHAIGPKEIEARIARALAARYNLGDVESLRVAFDRDVRALTLDASSPADLRVVRMSYDGSARRFDLTFEVVHGQGQRNHLRYTGTAVETVETAVLTRPLQRGEVVKAADIAMERRPRSDLAGEAPVKSDAVVGLALKRAMRASQPLRAADLAKPEIVQRNEMVTLTYQVPGVLLHMRVKALEAGAEGDVINLLNIQSKRTLQGVVTGPGRVAVASPTAAAPAPRLAAQIAAPSDPSGTVRR